MTISQPLLSVRGLTMEFAPGVRAVNDVSLSLERGEVLALVGESGSGKSATAFSILDAVDAPGKVVAGEIEFQGENLRTLTASRRRQLYGNRISMVFQDPSNTLNPVLTVGEQIIEAIRAHRACGKDEARLLARDALAGVGIPAAEERLSVFPHQMSGGMRQRVAIAIAMVNRPDLLIADEPTTALDVSVQAHILQMIQQICRRDGTALIWITHDLGIAAALATKIAVMYAGRVVESGPAAQVLHQPFHPYTRALVQSLPGSRPNADRLTAIPGNTPALANLPSGCAFRLRCPQADAACEQDIAVLSQGAGRSVRCINPLMEAAS
jgi:peptide/nickel transport system ATP-binding protein